MLTEYSLGSSEARMVGKTATYNWGSFPYVLSSPRTVTFLSFDIAASIADARFVQRTGPWAKASRG
jgi:hypothetical protein